MVTISTTYLNTKTLYIASTLYMCFSSKLVGIALNYSSWFVYVMDCQLFWSENSFIIY